MKQLKQKIISVALVIAALVVLFSSLVPIKVSAESYSDENEKTIILDKKVRSVNESEYKDNILSSEKVFYEDDLIEFKIRIENSGDTKLRNIKVIDKLPPFLKIIFNPGDYNETDNQVEWTIDELDAGEAEEFLIRAKIDQAENVYNLTKETNVAEACVDEICDNDDAIYYIGGISIPNTGAGGLIVQTGLILSGTVAGFILRKKARGY
jgi:uncharacterized repeat protein (TIGR01451 family)